MSTQLTELLIAYGVTAGAMAIGLLVTRAGARAWFRWPVYSAMVLVIAVVAWSQLRKHALPPTWGLTHPKTLYYCALGLYFGFGLGMGILLGRLTRRKTAPDEPTGMPPT